MISAKCKSVSIHPNHPTTATTDDIDLTLLFPGSITSASFQLGAWRSSSSSPSPSNSPPQQVKGCAKPQPPMNWSYMSDDDDSQSYDWSIHDDVNTDVDVDTAPEITNKYIAEETLLKSPLSQSMSTSVHTPSTSTVPCRVRFCCNIQVRLYEKSDPEDWVHLYYSAHELQRIMDSYAEEEEIRLQIC